VVKRKVLYDQYIHATEALTENVRKFDFAGIAVVWLARTGEAAGVLTYTPGLRWALLLFVGSLALDLLQFVYRAAMFRSLNRYHMDRGVKQEDEVEFSRRWNWPSEACFAGKVAACAAGLILLAIVVGRQIN
jgi:hypothetical protein